MKDLSRFVLVVLGFVVFGAFVNSNCKKSFSEVEPKPEIAQIDKNLMINWGNNFRGDTFTIASIRQAVVYARERCQFVEDIEIDSSYSDSGYDYDAMDIVKGDTLFTRVTLVETSDSSVTLTLIRVALRWNQGIDKTLETTVLDLLENYSLKKLEKSKRHG